MKAPLLLGWLLLTALAPAATVTMRFETTVNTTAFGGEASTPLVVTYSFDSGLIPGTGPGAGLGSYGPLSSMEAKLGNETISGVVGSGITVWNDSIDGDVYDVRMDFPEGALFGLDISGFRFMIVDPSGAMFADASLPTLLNLSATSDFYQQTNFDPVDFTILDPLGVTEFSTTPAGVRRPFTLTVIPEPSLLAICGIAVLGAVGSRRRVRV